MIRFEKISFEQYKKDFVSTGLYDKSLAEGEEFLTYVKNIYDKIKLPKRATIGSAGYDFFSPICVNLSSRVDGGVKDNITIPTGIRWITDRDDVVLFLFPRSGLGFKYGVSLKNTVGIIDSDYWCSSNEGHIMVKLQSDSHVTFDAGDAFCQGVMVPFLKTDEEALICVVRNGGFGSTDA